MYTYKAHVVSIYDGDTITVDIDLGFDMTLKDQKIRLYGINAPEMKGANKVQGTTARDALRGRILNKDIIIHTIQDRKEKFGRWLGKLEVDGENINDWMVANNYAIPFMDTGE